ncbi:MAG: MoaD/ThiS family protein [Sediminibacterium sp.]|uniref:MoaD/ThiS family protein n=1 Tax=Sediminibacterium sp. TaxID=1917865 RepID=UPI0025E482C0|nr:MoaD/ThiS family protein [Sediminibacterium sp.]MDO8995129.1 MoaD/ThiS family protein [Sediminibacterium sp.]
MDVQVIFFGSITDITLVDSVLLNNCTDLDSMVNDLIERYPPLANKKYFIAVNQKMVHENIKLKMGDTVAIMPPFSGG